MRNTILSLLVACGLLLVGPVADVEAQGRGVAGECQSIVGQILGDINQIDQGIDLVNNCTSIGVGFGEFFAVGCGEERTTGDVLRENGTTCDVLSTICDAVFTCFEMVPAGCDDPPVCAIP